MRTDKFLVQVQDEMQLGSVPKTWADIESLAITASDRLNLSLRIMAAGLHELKAIQRLGRSCKSVSHVLGAVKLCAVPTGTPTSHDNDFASDNGIHNCDTPSSAGLSTFSVDTPRKLERLASEEAVMSGEGTNGMESAENRDRSNSVSAQAANGQKTSTTRQDGKPQSGELTATHMLLVQPLGTPLYGSELTDPDLALKVCFL